MLTNKQASTMAEAAIAMPVVLMILVFTLNVTRAGYAAMAARNAANYGARVGAVAGSNARVYAESAARVSLAQSGVSGEFPVKAFVTGSGLESVVEVTVGWTSPTVFAGICTLFGEGCPKEFSGEARGLVPGGVAQMKRMHKTRGVSMALYAMFIALVGVPLMGLAVDGTRAWLAKAELANAVEAACSAYANTPEVEVFETGGGVRLGAKARSEGIRLFGYNRPREGGSLTSMAYIAEERGSNLTVVTATCSGRANFQPMILAGLVSFDITKTVSVKAKFGTATNLGNN